MKDKLKTYVIILSKVFLQGHSREGDKTNFRKLVEDRVKIHTIRNNYPLWEKRIREIQEGKAVLSIREWSGKPYNSKQVEIKRLTAEDCVGIQKLDLRTPFNYYVDGRYIACLDIALNDGLSSTSDWTEFIYAKIDVEELFKPLAIIHFTKFRY